MRINRYIKKALRKGYSTEEIKKRLMDNGYPEDIAIDLIDTYQYKMIREEKLVKTAAIALVLIMILLAIGIAIRSFSSGGPTHCGYDISCFLEKANKCKSATYFSNIDGTQFQVTSQSDCTYERTITGFSEEETSATKALMKDKKMVCTYDKGTLSESYFNTITGNIENCQGELKDVIYDVMIALYMSEV